MQSRKIWLCCCLLPYLAMISQAHGAHASGYLPQSENPTEKLHDKTLELHGETAQAGCYGLAVGTYCKPKATMRNTDEDAPEPVKTGKKTVAEYCHLKKWYDWCQRNYYLAGQETSRERIGKNTTQVNYSNGLRGWIRYCDDGSQKSQSTEISPGYLHGGPHNEAFVGDKDIEPITCKQGGKKTWLVDYHKERQKCLAEGRCEVFVPRESNRQLQWRACMRAYNNERVCGGYPIFSAD